MRVQTQYIVEVDDRTLVVKTKEDLAIVHDILYEKADRLMRKYNPCKIKNGQCLNKQLYPEDQNFCCDGCFYLSNTGCTTKALCCRLWLCRTVLKSKHLPEEFLEERKCLMDAMRHLNLNVCRGDRKASITAAFKSIS